MEEAARLPLDRPQDRGDTGLVDAARRDPAAFGELYQTYLARIYGYMRTRAPTDEDAADLAEQVFLQAFRSLPKYRERGLPFAAWLFRIARNVATDANRGRHATVPWEQLPEAAHPADERDPEAIALRRERIESARALVAGLSPERRELVSLRFVAGLTLHEIGAVIGKSESTVHHQLAVTLQQLKERTHGEE